MKTLLFYKNTKQSLLSYNDDWLDAFTNAKALDIVTCNLATNDLPIHLSKLDQFDSIIFLHSTNSNGISIPSLLVKALEMRKSKVFFFVGNEYKLMPQKISLIKEINADFIFSQLPQNIAEWLYEDCDKSTTISLPHALNDKVFKPLVENELRDIDFGVRSYEYPLYLGDIDRKLLLDKFKTVVSNKSLKLDIETNKNYRFNRQGWAQFLGSCKGTLSNEAGSSFLEKDDRTRIAVNSYQSKHDKVTFEKIYKIFFENYPKPVCGKCISSRHFDAIGTKTCQIMFHGRFNDILKANIHYISLNRDFSNLDDVLERFQDDSYRLKIVNTAYEYILDEHTHKHRVEKFLNLL